MVTDYIQNMSALLEDTGKYQETGSDLTGCDVAQKTKYHNEIKYFNLQQL